MFLGVWGEGEQQSRKQKHWKGWSGRTAWRRAQGHCDFEEEKASCPGKSAGKSVPSRGTPHGETEVTSGDRGGVVAVLRSLATLTVFRKDCVCWSQLAHTELRGKASSLLLLSGPPPEVSEACPPPWRDSDNHSSRDDTVRALGQRFRWPRAGRSEDNPRAKVGEQRLNGPCSKNVSLGRRLSLWASGWEGQ